MPSTFFGLNTAYTGLIAANASLNTTSNNISNMNTEGYSRQKVIQEASDALRTFTTYGCAGAGVDTIAVERTRDEFYDVRYWINNSYYGESESKQYYCRLLEDYFADDETTTGFSTIFTDMFKALEEVRKNAGDTSVKTNFMGYANNLVEYFNNMALNLESAQKDTNSEIKVQIDAVNTLAEQITTLNKQINIIEMEGSAANELRDQRTLILDKLSEIVSVETVEVPIYDANDPTRETGANNFIVRIAGGQELVNGNYRNILNCVARKSDEKMHQSDAEGLYDIYWNNSTTFSLTNPLIGGKLQGLIEMRDGNNNEFFTGQITGVSAVTDNGVLKDIVTVEITADYLKDITKCTLSDSGGKIMLGNQVYKYESWTMNYDAATDKYTYDFVMNTDNENRVSSDRVNKTASVGAAVSYQGIPYYQEQMNEFLRNFCKTFNDVLTQEGSVDAYGNPAKFMMLADEVADNKQYMFADSYVVAPDGSYSIGNLNDSYFKLTAKNFALSDEIQTDPNLFATHTGTASGQDAYDVVADLLDIQMNKDKMTFRGCSSSEFLQCILSDVALNANSAKNMIDNYESIKLTVENMRTSISGVDEDEEAVNLVKFQNAYNLASKMIQVLTECYDRLILNTGV